MAFTEVLDEAAAAEPVENEPLGSVSSLFSSALSCKEVKREAIGDTLSDVLRLIIALVLATSAPMIGLMVLSIYIIFAFGGDVELGLIAIYLLSMVARYILVFIIGGGLLSFINCKIAGHEYGWREYQIFISAMVWVGVTRVIAIVVLVLGMYILGVLVIVFGMALYVLAIMIAAIIVARYITLNYQHGLRDKPVRRAIHWIYAALAFLAFSLLLY